MTIKEVTNNYEEYMVRKGYSKKTILSYKSHLKCYLYREKGHFDIQHFNHYVYEMMNKGLSRSHCNQVINAIKLYARISGASEIVAFDKYPRPKRDKQLPKVLSKEEIKKIFINTSNKKHQTELMLAYSCGLRVAEVAHLQVNQIDSSRMLINIIRGKGRKNRIVPLSEKMLDQLRQYYQEYKPHKWLFEGQRSNNHITERSLQRVFNTAVSKAGIKKQATFHSLRHSYATHLLESGVDLRYIQELLGHANSKTTERYTHVSRRSIQNIPNPLDSL